MAHRLRIESLEDRRMLAGITASCDVPFASALNMIESEQAPFSGSAQTSQTAEYYVGTFYDVNKYWQGDGQLCWAAATSNILAYTNWGYSVFVSGENSAPQLFDDEYDIYDYFLSNFSNEGGNAFYGIPWFTIGEYDVAGKSGWSQLIGDGGNLFPGTSTTSIRVYLNSSTYSDSLMGKMSSYLKDGYGVAMSLGWYQADAPTSRHGGHSLTVWGYQYNPDLDPSNPEYYTALIVTNSDDNYTGTQVLTIEWNSEYEMYRLSDYAAGTAWIEDFTCLKSVETLEGITAVGYNGYYDGKYHSITVSGTDSETDTVIYEFNGTQSRNAPEFSLPGTYTVTVVVVRDTFEAVWAASVDITIIEDGPQLKTPSLSSVVSNGANSQKAEWTEVDGAHYYEIAWSSDGTIWDSALVPDLCFVISDLTYGQTVFYKVRAVGDGITAGDSEWSSVVSKKVVPMDIDGDGFIGSGDLSFISAAWFSADGDENWDPRCDIDGDGFIGPGDYAYLSCNWFKTEDDDDLIYPKVIS